MREIPGEKWDLVFFLETVGYVIVLVVFTQLA